jgi:hypothetical protein
MFTWPEIILLVLKLANAIMGEYKYGQAFQAGTDAAIAKEAATILAKTKAMQKVREEVNALTNDAVDKQLADLEPK